MTKFGKGMVIMCMPVVDVLVMVVMILVNGISLLPAVALGISWYERFPQLWSLIIMIPVCYFVYLLTFVPVSAIFKWIFAGKLVCGEFCHFAPEAEKWRRTMLFATVNERFGLVNTKAFAFLSGLRYRLFGSRIDYFVVTAFNCEIYEPELVMVGPQSLIGMGALLLGHITTGAVNRLRIGPIRIGSRCVIGCYSVIMCNVVLGDEVVVGTGAIVDHGARMGDRSVLLNNSYLPPSAVVPEDEVWGGTPARKIKDQIS